MSCVQLKVESINQVWYNRYMRTYRIQITADRYPTEYTVEASSWGTAFNRAIKEWSKRFKRSRAEELRVRAVRGGKLLKAT